MSLEQILALLRLESEKFHQLDYYARENLIEGLSKVLDRLPEDALVDLVAEATRWSYKSFCEKLAEKVGRSQD